MLLQSNQDSPVEEAELWHNLYSFQIRYLDYLEHLLIVMYITITDMFNNLSDKGLLDACFSWENTHFPSFQWSLASNQVCIRTRNAPDFQYFQYCWLPNLNTEVFSICSSFLFSLLCSLVSRESVTLYTNYSSVLFSLYLPGVKTVLPKFQLFLQKPHQVSSNLNI